MIPPLVVRGLIAPLWARRERSPYLRVAARLAGDERMSADERTELQWRALREIVRYAADRVPFYRDRFREIGFRPEDLRRFEDLERIPLLTKGEIREHAETLRAEGTRRDRIWTKKTSGSTGVSLFLEVDEDAMQWGRGVAIYRDGWTGWRLGEWRAFLWGNPPAEDTWKAWLRSRLLDRCAYLDTLAMDEERMDVFARRILALRPTLLLGHAHSLSLFARFWKARSHPDPRLRAVLSTAMVLHPSERRTIEAVFGVGVYDRYGCEEVSLIASECEAHRGLHLNTDSLHVELLAGGRPAPPGVEGAVVVTDLRNRAMPLIRYRIEDVAVSSAEACPCGRTYPLLARVAGRVADYLWTCDGKMVSGISLTENFATLIPGVLQVQIVQNERDHLLLRVVPEAGFGEKSIAAIRDLVALRFGAPMRFTIEKVARIEPESSGKYRFAICEVPLDSATWFGGAFPRS